jgi:hypothetical protein
MTEETERDIPAEERERIVEGLRRQMADGRLDRQEYEDRTRALLDTPTPSPVPSPVPVATPPSVTSTPAPEAQTRPREEPLMSIPGFRIHFFIWLVFAVFFNAIWFGAGMASGSWLPYWPIFPIAGIGLTVGIHAAVRLGQSP